MQRGTDTEFRRHQTLSCIDGWTSCWVLNRTRAQFNLVAEIGKHEAEMEEIVAGLV